MTNLKSDFDHRYKFVFTNGKQEYVNGNVRFINASYDMMTAVIPVNANNIPVTAALQSVFYFRLIRRGSDSTGQQCYRGYDMDGRVSWCYRGELFEPAF